MKKTQMIENMKKQTFGVEVEMNHITRRKAATIVAGYFGTGRVEDTALRNGYRTMSTWDTKGREWKFQTDASIAGPDMYQCEMVTPILTYEDMADLQAIVRLLRKAGAVSNPSQGCGVHIHIGANGHDAKTLRNLTNIMAAHESLIAEALKLDSYRLSQYCRVVDRNFLDRVNAEKPTTMSKLADIWYEGNGYSSGRTQHYNGSRYHMLNLHATFTKGTVEFRLFQFDNPGVNAQGKRYKGGLHAGQLKSYIQLCLALSQMAKEVKSASYKEPQRDNPKYAMRTWLLRMGFIGEEFATARDILTRNLSGDAAFRNGRTA